MRPKIEQYDFIVEYKPGYNNPADYLTRRYFDQNPNKISEELEKYCNFVTNY